MKTKLDVAKVTLWGEDLGAVAWDSLTDTATFEYYQSYSRKGIEVSPLLMPVKAGVKYSFPHLNKDTFKGLPGLLADCLPDKFGNALIDQWLSSQGRSIADFNPVERLCYIGARGMGAIEFEPAINHQFGGSRSIEIDQLVELSQQALNNKLNMQTNIDNDDAINMIIQVGTSAGGARAKAIIDWNPDTGDVRSGQIANAEGYEPWIIKFDGILEDNLGAPQGYGKIEYVYHQIAIKAGIEMSRCRLFEENGRSHFMTRRFDRTNDGRKIHLQTLCAIAHYDYNAAGAYSYEQAMQKILALGLGVTALTEFFKRIVFNIAARNQDDHTKNIAFIMGEKGDWNLSPAYDLTWSYNPKGKWTNQHQMSLNGKRDDFTLADLIGIAEVYDVRNPLELVEQVVNAVQEWDVLAADVAIDDEVIRAIKLTHRLYLTN